MTCPVEQHIVWLLAPLSVSQSLTRNHKLASQQSGQLQAVVSEPYWARCPTFLNRPIIQITGSFSTVPYLQERLDTVDTNSITGSPRSLGRKLCECLA